ncbi:unannotated protein [freshwater metagenome]|uniref:Unannotated protein n=1 Tax=freshwater metagenome TaxID=449393 RepID=A0A6J6I031_9ZZZZ|nr:hypothetical protein [Actinomycetota bacterium]
MNMRGKKRGFGTFSVLPLAVVLATLSLVVMSASPSRQEGSANAVATATITAPVAPSFSLNTAGQDPGNFVLSNFNAGDTLNVSVGFVNPPSGTTFALPTTTGLTAGFGYNFTGGKTQISFTGTMANSNAALAAMTVSTGSTNGTITIRVTASVNTANVYYNPINGHYYKYVNINRTADAAITAAESDQMYGVKGYLATITSAQEQAFIYANINASNLWVGGTDDQTVINATCGTNYANQNAAEGKWTWVTGPEACQQFWEGNTNVVMYWVHKDTGANLTRIAGNASNARYENWCWGNPSPYTLVAPNASGRSGTGEPNGAGGSEQFMVDKWGGSTCWNDWGRYASGVQQSIIEYSENWGTGANARGSFTGADVASAEVSALVDNSPKDVVATRNGSGSMSVSWTAPLTGTVSSYTVASTPGSRTCTVTAPATSCTVTGLTNGTAYTFIVTATFADSTTKASLASSSVTADDGLTPVASAITDSVKSSANASVRSSKLGTLYLVNTSVNVSNLASITGAAGSLWNQVTISSAGVDTNISASGLDEGTYKAYAKDALGVLSAASSGTVTVDDTSPTVTLSVASSTAVVATISFKVTGNEAIDCSSLSTTIGTDFDVTNISSLVSIDQTSSALCTVNARSVAAAGGGSIVSTLESANSFSVADSAGNTQGTLTGSPKSITVTIPQNTTTTSSTTTVPAATSENPSGGDGGSATPVGSVQTTTTVPTRSVPSTSVASTTTTIAATKADVSTADDIGGAPTAPTAKPGEVTALVGGANIPVAVERKNNEIMVKVSSVSLVVKGLDEKNSIVPLDVDGALRIKDVRKLEVVISGLAPNSQISAWMFSTPLFLGKAKSDEFGNIRVTFDSPENVEIGSHRHVFSSISSKGENLVVSLGSRIQPDSSGPLWSWVLVLLLIIAIGAGLIIPARRRRAESNA